MSNKLRTWKCPKCGIQGKVPRGPQPIRCVCGYVDIGNPEHRALAAHRLSICLKCPDYENGRCKYVELGCKRALREKLADPDARCPQLRWEHSQVHRFTIRPGVRLLNIIYHVYPSRRNDVWRANVRRIVGRLPIFNGKRIVAVALDDKTHRMDEVVKAFGSESITFLKVVNDPELREAATLLPLLEQVASTNEEEASFYAHTKGNSTCDSALGAELWRNAMYHHLLDHVHVCRDLLWTHPCVGTHKMIWPADQIPYPTQLAHGHWMFAGTFWWMRHKDVFAHPKWREVPADRYGAEAYLSGLFEPHQAASVFQPWAANEYPTPSPYDPRLYLYPIRDT